MFYLTNKFYRWIDVFSERTFLYNFTMTLIFCPIASILIRPHCSSVDAFFIVLMLMIINLAFCAFFSMLIIGIVDIIIWPFTWITHKMKWAVGKVKHFAKSKRQFNDRQKELINNIKIKKL